MSADYNSRAAKGQAYNLAVWDAISSGEADNPKYIYKRFLYYFSLGDALQGSDFDLIQEVVDDKNFDKVLKKLKEVLK